MASVPKSHRKVREARRRMFAEFGTRCHLCGHFGATEADHLIPYKDRPDLIADWTNMRPAHGALYRSKRTGEVIRDARCKTCGKACNQSRGTRRLDERPVTSPASEVYERQLD